MSCKARRKLLQLSFIVSQNLKSKDVTVFTQFAIYQSQSFKITQYSTYRYNVAEFGFGDNTRGLDSEEHSPYQQSEMPV